MFTSGDPQLLISSLPLIKQMSLQTPKTRVMSDRSKLIPATIGAKVTACCHVKNESQAKSLLMAGTSLAINGGAVIIGDNTSLGTCIFTAGLVSTALGSVFALMIDVDRAQTHMDLRSLLLQIAECRDRSALWTTIGAASYLTAHNGIPTDS